VKLECWKSTRVIGSASTIDTAAAGRSRKRIVRAPAANVVAKPSMSPRAASPEMRGKSTAETATEKSPCGSMNMRNA
jgi:hypothetical protein